MTKLTVTKTTWCCIFQYVYAKAADAKRKRDRLSNECSAACPDFLTLFCYLGNGALPANRQPVVITNIMLRSTAAASPNFPSFFSSNWISGHRPIFQCPGISTVHICRFKSGFTLRLYIHRQVLV